MDDEIVRPPWGELGRSATLGLVSGLGKILLHVFNTTQFRGPLDSLNRMVLEREQGRGLLTGMPRVYRLLDSD